MLKVACLPSHPLGKLVAKKKQRGSEGVYEALLPPTRSTAKLFNCIHTYAWTTH